MKNIDRSAGTILGAEITRFHKEGLPEDTIVVNCKGVGGQSFGAFIPKGLTMTLCNLQQWYLPAVLLCGNG